MKKTIFGLVLCINLITPSSMLISQVTINEFSEDYFLEIDTCFGKDSGFEEVIMKDGTLRNLEWDRKKQLISVTWEKNGIIYIRSVFLDDGYRGVFMYPDGGRILDDYQQGLTFVKNPGYEKDVSNLTQQEIVDVVFVDIVKTLRIKCE